VNCRGIVRAALATLLAAGAAMLATASPANASTGSDCRFELVSVKANELQEANQDEIFLWIGDDRTDRVTFIEKEVHFAPDFGTSAQTGEFIAAGDTILIRVIEADFPSGDETLGSFHVSCGSTSPRDVSGFGSDYVVTFRLVAP
jgi:hypothetical protein